MTAGIRLKPAMKPSLAPVPPEPIRLAPVSPMVPKAPDRLVKSSTLIGPSMVRKAPERISTMSAIHAPTPTFSLFAFFSSMVIFPPSFTGFIAP